MSKQSTTNNKPRRSDIALDFIRRVFEGSKGDKAVPAHSLPTNESFDIDKVLSSVAGKESPRTPSKTSIQAHQLVFGFTEESWKQLHEVGLNIGTAEPSQIVRRALALLWLVTRGNCSIKDNVSGNVVEIPE